MAVEIGSRWLDELIEVRALVREALQEHKLNDFPLYVLRKERRKENSVVMVFYSPRSERCRECGERIEEKILKVM